MFELGVAIRVRRTFAGLLQRVQPIAEPMQELPDRRRTDQPPLRGERPREARRALAGPPQPSWRHRVAPCQRFDQEVQRLGHPGLGLLNIRTPGPGTANPVRRRHALRQLQTPIADRLPGQPRRGRDHRVPAEADRHRFRRRPQSPRALIEQSGPSPRTWPRAWLRGLCRAAPYMGLDHVTRACGKLIHARGLRLFEW